MMSAFYSSQAYDNFINEISQKASQVDNQNEQYVDEEAQAKENSTMMGTELLAQSAPMLVHTVARVGNRIKSVVEAVSKAKTAVEKGIATVKDIPNKIEKLGTRLNDIGTNALNEGQVIAERTGARLNEIGTTAVAQGRSIADNAVARGRQIADDFTGEVQKFGKMSQDRLNDISDNTKSFIDGKMEAIRAKGQQITPELQAKYERFSALTGDKSPEGIAKLQSSFKDFTFKNSPVKSAVSSTGKEAVSKLNPREHLAKLQSTLEDSKSKVANFVKEKESTISTLRNIHSDKLQELAQRRATLQRKLQSAETKQESFDNPKEARYIAPEESAYRSGGSVRLPARSMGGGGNGEDLSGNISSFKRDMANIDGRMSDLGKEHIEALQRVEDFHIKNIQAPLAKIEEVSSSLEATGKSALTQGRAYLGTAMEHIAPVLDIGFAGQSLNNLAHGGDNGNIGGELNDLNMVRHGTTSGFEAGKAVLDKVASRTAGVATDTLQATKGALQTAGTTAVDATNEGLQAGKTLAVNTAKEVGSTVAETVGEVLGPVGEVADAGLLLYSLFSGISDIKSAPYIAPPPPQQINVVHQAGIS